MGVGVGQKTWVQNEKYVAHWTLCNKLYNISYSIVIH